ncbi:cytochrome c [bacterium]|nr:cytochrome c [bacterium]
MKIKFRTLAILFCIAFIGFSGVLIRYMVRSISDSQAIVAAEIKKNKIIHLEQIPTHNEGLEMGGILYVNQCATCHGSKATGGVGPALIRPEWRFDRDNVRYIVDKVRNGSPAAGMPAFAGRIRDEDIGKIIAYIEAMNSTKRGQTK